MKFVIEAWSPIDVGATQTERPVSASAPTATAPLTDRAVAIALRIVVLFTVLLILALLD